MTRKLLLPGNMYTLLTDANYTYSEQDFLDQTRAAREAGSHSNCN